MYKRPKIISWTAMALILVGGACLPSGFLGIGTEPPTTATETPTSLPTEAVSTGPFRKMTTAQGWAEGTAVHDLWIAADGALWAATEDGLYLFDAVQRTFSHVYESPLLQIVGVEESTGTLWALGAGGTSIHSFDGREWLEFGADEGWQALPEGTREGTLADDGRVWLATGNDDLRLFDPASMRWDSLQATDIGFTPADPDYQGHYLTDVINVNGAIWVADCIGMGEGFAGQGVRALVDNVWVPLAETDGLCIFEIEKAADGRIWIGGEDTLLIYDPTGRNWSETTLPPWDRFQFIVDIAFDPLDDLVVNAMQCGGASCDTIHTYTQQGNDWQPILNAEETWYPGPTLAFDPSGATWSCWQGNVYQQVGEETRTIGRLETTMCEVRVDGDGTVWVAAENGGDAGLWQVQR